MTVKLSKKFIAKSISVNNCNLQDGKLIGFDAADFIGPAFGGSI
jgi:hypothetical protein